MAFENMDVTVGPGWQPWPERPKPPPKPQLVQRWPKEPMARAALEHTLAPYGFVLVSEVRLLERGHPFQWIDYVAICPEGWPVKAFGIEVKVGFDKLIDGLDAVTQALRYRKAVVSDDRIPCVLGERLEHIFIWPSLNWADDCSHHSGARAIRILAGRSNVGSVDAGYTLRYPNTPDGVPEWKPRIKLMLGQGAFWTSRGFEMLEGYFGAASKHVGNVDRGLRSVE